MMMSRKSVHVETEDNTIRQHLTLVKERSSVTANRAARANSGNSGDVLVDEGSLLSDQLVPVTLNDCRF